MGLIGLLIVSLLISWFYFGSTFFADAPHEAEVSSESGLLPSPNTFQSDIQAIDAAKMLKDKIETQHVRTMSE